MWKSKAIIKNFSLRVLLFISPSIFSVFLPFCPSILLSLHSLSLPSLSAHTFSSGMAAVSTVMQALLKSGDHIVSVNDVYGGVNRFFRKVASGFNISVTLVDATNTSNVENAIKDNTKVREREEIESEKKREKREGGRREREGEKREEGREGEERERRRVYRFTYVKYVT